MKAYIEKEFSIRRGNCSDERWETVFACFQRHDQENDVLSIRDHQQITFTVQKILLPESKMGSFLAHLTQAKFDPDLDMDKIKFDFALDADRIVVDIKVE